MTRPLLARLDCLPQAGQHHGWRGLPGCGSALAIAELVAGQRRPLVILASTVAQAEMLDTELQFFLGNDSAIALLPDLEVLPYDSFSPHQDLVSGRLRILRDLRLGSISALITAVPTVLPRVPPTGHLQANAVRLDIGESLTLRRG